MAWLDENQETLHMEFRVPKPGPYVMIITYHTPENSQGTTASIEISSEDKMEKGMATFYECSYSFLCRQVVIDQYGQVSMFDVDSDYVTAAINLEEEANIGIDNVALVPAYLWTMDYVIPKSVCVKREGECIKSEYTLVPESTKVCISTK